MGCSRDGGCLSLLSPADHGISNAQQPHHNRRHDPDCLTRRRHDVSDLRGARRAGDRQSTGSAGR